MHVHEFKWSTDEESQGDRQLDLRIIQTDTGGVRIQNLQDPSQSYEGSPQDCARQMENLFKR